MARKAVRARVALSGPAIVRAAIAIADEDGLSAVTMREVAQRLGVTAMALYRHVANREVLVELMIDHVVGEFAYPEPRPSGWRETLRVMAVQDWRSYFAHPWMLAATATSAPPTGPRQLASMEWSLTGFDNLDLSGPEKLYLLGVVSSYGRGLALTWIAGFLAGGGDRERTAHRWREGPDALSYPRLNEVAAAIGAEPVPGGLIEEEFEFGLARVLDGIQVYLERRVLYTL
ncbi:TetR/AcrR family transcriptional regulator [Nonomuraea sp. NPDC050790]|uniref:TetR/AcrR family transcriptional regulator n=1 Tax=Nonomuraea sp. NPDC050790 TaxID=3364371 RepID=UPI0037873519